MTIRLNEYMFIFDNIAKIYGIEVLTDGGDERSVNTAFSSNIWDDLFLVILLILLYCLRAVTINTFEYN
jgi:hypothetical protein